MMAMLRRVAIEVSRDLNLAVGTGHSSAKSSPTTAGAQCFPAGDAGVGEVEVFHHDRRAVVVEGQVEQRGDRGLNLPITARCPQTRRLDRDGDGFSDRVPRGIQHTSGEVVGVQLHTQHPASSQRLKLRGRRRGSRGGEPACGGHTISRRLRPPALWLTREYGSTSSPARSMSRADLQRRFRSLSALSDAAGIFARSAQC